VKLNEVDTIRVLEYSDGIIFIIREGIAHAMGNAGQ